MRRLAAVLSALILGSGAASAIPLPPEQEFTNQTPYGTPDASVVAPPEGYGLIQLQTVSRHGARSQTSDTVEKRVLALWEKARKKGKLTTLGKGLKADVQAFQVAERRVGYGDLSKLGAVEWSGIGTRWAAAYEDFLEQAQADGDTISYVTTDRQRTVDSMTAQRSAFRSAGLTALDDRSTSTVDPSLYGESGLTTKGSTAVRKIRARDSVKDASKALLKKIYTSSFVKTIDDPVAAAKDVYALYCTAPGMALDSDVTFAKYVPTAARISLSQLRDGENFYRYGPGITGQRSSFDHADPVLKSFFSEIDQRIAGGGEAAVIRHAHGETIMPFAARIRIVGADQQLAATSYYSYSRSAWRGSVQGRLAGNIEWALYEKGDDHLVAVRQNEAPVRLAGCDATATWFYDLDELRSCLEP